MAVLVCTREKAQHGTAVYSKNDKNETEKFQGFSRGSGHVVFKMPRIGSGRVGSGSVQNLTGRVGSGQEVFKSCGSGQVGSGRVTTFSNLTGRVKG